MAPTRSLGLSFSDQTLLRGSALPGLLRWCGRHLVSPQVAEGEKAGLLRESRVVTRLGVFVSHSWRDPGTPKYLCMLLYCNGLQAAALSVAASAVACVLVIVGALPLWQYNYAPWPTLVGVPLFYLSLFFLHHAPRWLGGGRGTSYFLDKLCIDQCDPARKKAGIESLGAFIAASDRLLVMWSPTYLTRLWCTVELATFLHVRAQVPGGLSERSLRGSLVFRPLQLPGLMVVAMVVLQLGTLTVAPRYFIKSMPLLGWVKAYLVVPTIAPLAVWLGVVHKARAFARDREDLDVQLAQFRIEGADCSQDSDRDIIYATVRDFFGSLDAFNQLMRTCFREVVPAGLPGRNGVPLDVLVFLVLPFVFNALDWAAHNALLYGDDWEPLVSHTVFVFASILNVWLVIDLIFRLVNTRRASGMWRPGAARNMMVSLAITVPFMAIFWAQAGLGALLRWRHPALIGAHCLLTCSVLLVARRCRWR